MICRPARRAEDSPTLRLLLLLDDLLELRRHSRDRLPREPHLAVGPLSDHDVEAAPGRVLFRVIIPIVPTAAFPAFDGGAGDGLGDGEQVAQVERGVPAWIVFPVAGDA